MRLKLTMAPWWVQGLVSGLLFGAAMTVFAGFRDGRWAAAAATGAVAGVFFGLAMGVMGSKINRRVLAGLEDLPPDELRTVARAASRGPAPADPRLREAAAGLVCRRRDEVLRTRRVSIGTFSVAVPLYVVLALTSTRWWWLAAVMFLVFLVATLLAPARLDRRLAVLQPGLETAGGPRAC